VEQNSDYSVKYLKSLNAKDLDNLIIREKKAFILWNFVLDHPETLVESSSQLEFLLNESNTLRGWSRVVNDRWSVLNDVPDWLINSPELRDVWMSDYQSELVALRLVEQQTLRKNNEARKIYDETVEKNNDMLFQEQCALYERSPVILIHRITPGALSESDLLKLHSLNKEERRMKRKELLDDFKLELLNKYNTGEISKEDLLEYVK